MQGAVDGFLAAILLALVPPASYAAAHARSLLQPQHAWSLLLLASAPMLFLTCLEVRPPISGASMGVLLRSTTLFRQLLLLNHRKGCGGCRWGSTGGTRCAGCCY